MCGVCLLNGLAGGYVGAYFGVPPPQHPGGQILSSLITANLVGMTVVALKAMFNISLCGGREVNLTNIILVGVKTVMMGIIYSIGVNYLLNRYVFPSSQGEDNPQGNLQQDVPHCHCK